MSTVTQANSNHLENADHGQDDLLRQILEHKNDIANGVVTEELLEHFCNEMGLETGSKSEMQVKILAAVTDKLMAALPQPKKLRLSVSNLIDDLISNPQQITSATHFKNGVNSKNLATINPMPLFVQYDLLNIYNKSVSKSVLKDLVRMTLRIVSNHK